jgi:hypothetical protein
MMMNEPYQKPIRKVIPFLGESTNTMELIILVRVIRGVLFMPITTQFTCNTPLQVSHKTFGLHNISLEFGRVLQSLSKI